MNGIITRLFGRTSRTTMVTWFVGVALGRVAINYLLTGSLAVPAMAPFQIASGEMSRGALAVVDVIATLVLLIIQARRFHDQDRSGWFALAPYAVYALSLIVPAIGIVLMLVVLGYIVALFLPPTVGPNRFGPDPRGWRSPEHRAEQDQQLRQPK
jgi:uncharacterized membrane protein YhaH (DUF805 family)